jgi:GR25 family glycosyltransferase involved in LPS biosynthesis
MGVKSGIKSYKKIKCEEQIPFETYVINCGVHSKRLNTFKKYAKKAKLNIKREECVNGKEYTNKTLIRMVNAGIVSPDAELSPIEVAICLSHYNCWVRFVKNGCSDYGLIMEDDAKIKPDFVTKITSILEQLEYEKKKFGVLIIHPGNWMHTKSRQRRVSNVDGVKINRETTNHNPSGTAYILTLKFANHLINNMFPIVFPVDIYIGDNLSSKFPHFTLIPQRDPKTPDCWSGPLLDVNCGGGDDTTQDYEADNIKTIFSSL